MEKPILLSGIQPTGRLHLGNYLGALKHFVELQNSDKYHCYFLVVDSHSLTADFDPSQKKQQTLGIVADYLATGLDPKKSTIFVQSHVPAHTELAWYLNTITYFGELSRMTQFKDKSANQEANVNVGLFTYPILMTADIILYDAHFVPVGNDQTQHLEFARNITHRFNNKFGQTFVEPQPLFTKVPRLMSLVDPNKKMSKSQTQGCLFIDDSPENIEEKVMAATTDSGSEIKYDPQNKPGISNLLLIYSALSGKEISELENDFAHTKKYTIFKKKLAKVVAKYFAAYRRKKTKLMEQPEKLEKVAQRGAKVANKVANEKIIAVRSRLGLL